MTDPDMLVSAATVATMLGIARRTVYKWMRSGRLDAAESRPSHSGSRPQYLFRVADVEAAGRLLSPAAQELARRRSGGDPPGRVADQMQIATSAAEIREAWWKASGADTLEEAWIWVSERTAEFRAEHPRLARRWVFHNYGSHDSQPGGVNEP